MAFVAFFARFDGVLVSVLSPGFVLLLGFAFAAGLVDAVVGGGGLIQLPGLFLILPPAVPVASVFGTNKLAAFAGTSVAALRYGRHVSMDAVVLAPASACAFTFSVLGANTVRLVDPARFKPIILLMLVLIAAYTYLQKEFGIPRAAAAKTDFWARLIRSALTGAFIGFYDGFLGPGTGSLLIFCFVALLGYEFLQASATAKVVNVVTNLGALVTFGRSGNVLWTLAVCMAVFNILGATVGARLAILRGSRFVRIFFLIVVGAVIARFAYDLYAGGGQGK